MKRRSLAKEKMVVFGLLLLTAAALLGQWGTPTYASIFPAYVAGLVSLVGVFVGGHAATDIAALKHGAHQVDDPDAEPTPAIGFNGKAE